MNLHRPRISFSPVRGCGNNTKRCSKYTSERTWWSVLSSGGACLVERPARSCLCLCQAFSSATTELAGRKGCSLKAPCLIRDIHTLTTGLTVNVHPLPPCLPPPPLADPPQVAYSMDSVKFGGCYQAALTSLTIKQWGTVLGRVRRVLVPHLLYEPQRLALS